MIVQPAARVGVTFTNELLERLKLDAPTSDALPLLGFTLEKLFRQCAADKLIELGEYERLGGMTGAISQAVQKILPAKLQPETEQALRLSFVRHLVQVNEKDEFVRRPARWSQLPTAARPLLEKFVNERLMHTSGDGDATTIEVSHEALFRCWDQLAKWLQESRRLLRWRSDVERDRRTYGSLWTGLSDPQLAIARDWLEQQREELTSAEIAWIQKGLKSGMLGFKESREASTLSRKIFISYRRIDADHAAERIYERLGRHFGFREIFYDVDSIPPGADFANFITEKLSECGVLLAIIGNHWVNAQSKKGSRRLDDPQDWVRLEIESALASEIAIIPVLVGEHAMPNKLELPPSIQAIAERQWFAVSSGRDFHGHVTRLIDAVEKLIGPSRKKWWNLFSRE